MVSDYMYYIHKTFIDSGGYVKYAEVVTSQFLDLNHSYKLVTLDSLEQKFEEYKNGSVNIDYDIENGFLKTKPVESSKMSEQDVVALGIFAKYSPETKICPLPKSIYSLLANMIKVDGYFIDVNEREANKLSWNDNSDIGVTSFNNIKYEDTKMLVSLYFKGMSDYKIKKIISINSADELVIDDFYFAVPSEHESNFTEERGIELIDRDILFGKKFTLFRCYGSERLVMCYLTPFTLPIPIMVRYAYLSKAFKTIAEVLKNFRSYKFNVKTLGEYTRPIKSQYDKGVFFRTNYVQPNLQELRTSGINVYNEVKDFIKENKDKSGLHKVLKYIDSQNYDEVTKIALKDIIVIAYNCDNDDIALLELLNKFIYRIQCIIVQIDNFLFACRATEYFDYYYKSTFEGNDVSQVILEYSGDSPYNAIYERRLK